MTLRIFLVSLLAVGLVGFVSGQSTTQKKVEIVKYPLPGAEDRVGIVETEEERKVLDDFDQSKAEVEFSQAGRRNDTVTQGRYLADQLVWATERLGTGERLNKEQVLDDFKSGHTIHIGNKAVLDQIRVVAFGENVVVESGRSRSHLTYGGKDDNDPRVFTNVWVKQHGQWQIVAHSIANAPNGLTRGFEK